MEGEAAAVPVMTKGTIVILGREPLDSFCAANRLDLLLRPGMPVVIVDGVFDKIAADAGSPRSREISRSSTPTILVSPSRRPIQGGSSA